MPGRRAELVLTKRESLGGRLEAADHLHTQGIKKAGITLDIELVEHATFHAKIREDLSPIVHYAAARFPVATST